MLSSWIWSLSVLAVGLQQLPGSHSNAVSESEQPSRDSQPGASSTGMQVLGPDMGPLLLSSYIEACDYDKAKQLSKVELFQQYAQATAYSGYITVNSTTKSHLFFLFIVSQGNNSNDPFLLWTQGGPGLSALFGQFLQNGPVAFSLPMNLTKRTNTLHQTMNLLYLDVPVGAGFSYTETQDGYSKSLEDITKDITEFLNQFFQLFFEYKNRDFYFGGESYGARYSVAVAHDLLKDKRNLPINVKGVIGGNGFLGPILETAESSDFLYQTSMLTEEGRQIFKEAFKNVSLLRSSSPQNAILLLFSAIFADFTHAQRTLFQNLTLYNDHASPLHTERPLIMLKCYGFLSDPKMKVVFHAGINNTFEYNNENLQTNLLLDWLRDITNMTEDVLNKTKVLLYTGQLDALFPSVNQRTYFSKLQWRYAEEYKTSERCLWKLPNQPYNGAGYLKQATTLWEAVVLGMSHYGAVDKPDAAWHLITKFIEGTLACPSPTKSQEGLKEN
uniref:Serine carboxypeptidase n=1 Tax=Rhipicephalus appendiculatus TaxID=34631 RepID=A0A131Z0V2_RHIAP